jgi:nitric oxide reductase subunit B
MMYFRVAIVLFGAQLLMGLIAGLQYLYPGFLFNLFDFNVARMVHINALVVWMLYAMIGSVYLMLPDETGIQNPVAIGLGKLGFWVLTAAVTVVVLVYIFIQVGSGTEATIWLINEGREYIEAPRWADIGIVVVVLIFYANVFFTYMKGEKTGIMTVMVADLLALAGLYLAGMFFTDNISMDQYWWWWVIHLWVEATWEVFVGTLAAYGLIKILGAKREIVEMWLWIEVLMLFGSGILGLGHHYFWIGTPEYWWEIGALFSALEPVPLVAMFVHVLYDWGKEQGHADAHGKGSAIGNGPAMAWISINAFGNFLGAGIWGFFHTLPQVNIYTHGSQFTAAHGHLAFFGAYATILIGMMYLGIQDAYGIKRVKATFKSKMAIGLITFGVVGMTVALTIAGYEQVLVERAELGAGWQAYFTAQNLGWMVQAQTWREIMGVVTFVGFVYLVLDLLTIGKVAKAADEA